jgi:hypothetical protein
MLSRVFLETPDYKTILSSTAANVVVGRRGTGKSALLYKLSRALGQDKHILLVEIAPEEEQIIGIRPLLQFFGEKFTQVRAGAKLMWRYAMTMEVLDRLSTRYKSSPLIASSALCSFHLKRWRSAGPDIVTRQCNVLKAVINSGLRSEEIIGELANKLQIREIDTALHAALDESNSRAVILGDKLDEGYEHDTHGVAFVDGAIYGLTDFCASVPMAKGVLFLRDNIFRTIALRDPDFSRNIEGQSLRLHWDTYQLFNMVCNRLRVAFAQDIENNQRLWDRCTANELQHQDGFKKCLQLTLYRPRDLIILLNQAFHNASKQDRAQIILSDIEISAKHISSSRLADLHTEYGAIFPGIQLLTAACMNRSPELSGAEIGQLLSDVIRRDEFPVEVQQDFALFHTPEEQIHKLYSVGFIGVHEKENDGFRFCHDGSQPDREFKADDRLLVHPCYWLALNLTRNSLNPEEAENINDEYEIEAVSSTPEIRKHKIGQLMAELDKIPEGDIGAQKFEDWCAEVHPNRNATQRRDVVGRNQSTKGTWEHIYNHYKTRQVIFEVKNYSNIGLDEYRQMLSYLCDDYGKAGFIITRDSDHMLTKGAGLDHFLEMYHKHNVFIVKLTGKFLCAMLSKLRNPQKHDAADNLLGNLLDVYSRRYLSGVAEAGARTKKRRK